MKKKVFVFVIIVLLLFIINQLITGFLDNPPQINSYTLTNNTQVAPQKLFDKTWKEISSEFYDYSLNSQDWEYWKKHYKNKIKTDEDAKVAIDTMLLSLNDDYSRYMNAKEYSEQNSSIESKISGIGVNIANKSGKIVVYSVLDKTPAQKAGIKANDIIKKVDGKDVSGMNISDVASLVRGKEGTVVKLLIKRDNKYLTKSVIRQSIKINTVEYSVKGNLGYIRISTFIGNDTSVEFLNALQKTKDTQGLILDLRGNTGGLLANAIFIANLFIQKGTIVNIVSRNGKVENIKAQPKTLLVDKPLVILVDGASASASEILSGALKDNKRAVLIGTNTFGKGMVQRIIPLPNSTGLNLTIAKYLTPNGTDINKKGIAPDYEVKYSNCFKDLSNDNQIKEAERILISQINKSK